MFFALLLLVSTCAANAQTAHQPFTVTISTQKPIVKAGDDVYIDIGMTNTSDHDVDCTIWIKNASDRSYQYNVSFEDGKPARDIDKHVRNSSPAWPCVLKPGESQAHTSGALINTIYDFSRPGKYTVQVTRKIWGDENRPETILPTGTADYHQLDVKSNIITITVLPKDPPAEEPK